MAQNHRRWITVIFYGIGMVGIWTSTAQGTDMDFGKRKAIEASAQVSVSPPQIALVWPVRTDIAAYQIRRVQPDGTIDTFSATGDSAGYVDTDVTAGVGITYLIKAPSNSGFSTAYGHVLAGINVPAEESRGIIILVVDENQVAPLSSELERLHRDLVGDGWQVYRHDVSPTLSPPAIKSIIQNRYDSEPSKVRAVLLLGDIAVPYSGNRAPDGHYPNHEGAWPADTYYADMSGTWTDATINNTAASGTRNDNVPGDGKFDPSNVPAETKLSVGRVDLSNMPAFASSETELLRNYLDKNHAYRNAIAEIEQRAIVDANLDEVINGSGQYTFSEGFASTARRSFSAMFGTAKVVDSDWFPEVETNTYAWGYAGGYGGYSHLTGLATTSQLAAKNPNVVFTMLAGSYFGDWDTPDNFLRAPLCTGSTLASCWTGRPGWLFYRMALGQTLGDCTLETQNSSSNFYIQQGAYARGVHVNLMGDPTLRLHMIKPPVQLSAIGDGEGTTELTWVEPSDRDDVSYRIYRSPSINDPFVRIDDEEETISATSFSDPSPIDGSIYMVRTLALTASASGSYYNLSQGTFAAQIPPITIPVIVWNDPVAITYGTALDTAQLNATANVAGTFGYVPASETVLDAGTHTLTTTFTPTDTARYASASKTATLTVNKAVPTITWNPPAAVTYGTALSDTHLNATASSPGTLSYTPATGTVLHVGSTQQLQVSLPESANHTAANASVTIDVTPAPLTITADDKQRGAGVDNPPLTASYSGLVNGDTAISTPPALATTAEKSSAPGSYPITVTGGSDANYTISHGSGTLTIAEKEVPVIVWNDPVAITYGTALDTAQWNATANVAGTFGYVPASETVLDAGTHTLTTTFTPTDTARYASASKTVAITVNKAAPTITWNPPAAVIYGTALSDTHLNATASSPGTLSYTPATGTVLHVGSTQQLQVSLPESANHTAANASVTIDVIPAPLTITADDKQRAAGFENPPLTASYSGLVNGDTAISTPPTLATTAERSSAPGNYPITVAGGSDANYTISHVDGTLTVAEKEIPVIVWKDPVAITYGTALDTAQWNATANVAGTFGYVPASETVLDAGTHTLTTTFTPTDTARYASASKTVAITVNKAAPTITWNPPATIIYGTALGATHLNATTSFPGTLSYTPATGTVLHVGSTQQLQVSLPESANHTAANASVTIDVTPAPLAIIADDKQRAAGFENPPLTASYSGLVNGDTAVSTPPTLATTAEKSSAPGSYPITVTGGSDANYTVSHVDGTLTVAEKEIPVVVWNDPVAITYGTALGNVQLNATASVQGTFRYAPASETVLDAGTHTLTTTFTPTDTARYASASKTATLTVNKAVPTITWNPPAAITYGTVLSDTQLNATSDAPGTFVYALPAGTILNANKYKLMLASLPESANFSVGNAVVTIGINPAPLTITADDKQRGAGVDNPPLTASYSGLVNGDTAISTPPILATTAEKSSAPGNYPITVTSGSDPNYTITFVDGTLRVADKEVPVINWNTPAEIASGTPLGSEQLNATISRIEGSFVYTPASGEVLDVGTHTLTAEFTPVDPARYATATATVAITVKLPASEWQNPDNPFDVFADGIIDSRDVSVALILINSAVTNDRTYPDAGICPDVDGDRKVTLLDVDAVASQLPEEMLETLLPKDLPAFKLRPQVATVGLGSNGVILSFLGESGKTYDLQYSGLSNAPVWETLMSDLSGEIHFEGDNSERQSRPGGFYRFVGRPGKGDFDENGVFGDHDIDILTTAIHSDESASMYDLNEDGTVDMSDRKFFVEHQTKLHTSLGDLNLNGEVDFLDYLKFTKELGRQNSIWATGDFDGDGTTGLSDFLLLSENFGTKRPVDAAYVPHVTPVTPVTPWQNIAWREDVNADGSVDAADVVVLINQLEKMKAFGTDPAQLPDPTEINSPLPYVDTNGDGMLSPSDATKVQKVPQFVSTIDTAFG